MDISYRVKYESPVDRNLKESFQEYKRDHQDNLSFKHYVKKLGVDIQYHSTPEFSGYSLLFDRDEILTHFLLMWE